MMRRRAGDCVTAASDTAVALPASYAAILNSTMHPQTHHLPVAVDVKPTAPWVEIVEQPKQRGLRFRYKCEGRSAGSILGERSTTEQKTFPKIRIHNFEGSVAIVVVSCVTHDAPHSPHPHSLVGTDCKDGVCTIKVKGQNTITFTNIGIQCCKRQEVSQSLKTRDEMRVNPFGTPACVDTNKFDLSTVRLCFQVFLPDIHGKFTRIVSPVISEPIIDKKSVRDLVICRLSRHSGYAVGGDEVFLLCEKINKEDIQVRFYEEGEHGISWEAFGEFSSQDVHHQYAIVFQTPPYKDPQITTSVQVYVQLRRPSDDDLSDPKPFQYIPVDPDPYLIHSKRKRLTSDVLDNSSMFLPATVIPLSVKDDFDDSLSSSNDTSNFRQTIKNKIERKLSKKGEPIQVTLAAAAALPQYITYNNVSTSSPGPSTSTAVSFSSDNLQSFFAATGTAVVIGDDGKFYAIPQMSAASGVVDRMASDAAAAAAGRNEDAGISPAGLDSLPQPVLYDLSRVAPLRYADTEPATAAGSKDQQPAEDGGSLSDVIAAATSTVDDVIKNQR